MKTQNGYKLTNDFEAENLYGQRVVVRDINYTPEDLRLPDAAICRVFSSRADAERILCALATDHFVIV